MELKTLEQAISLASTLRQLRDADMNDARRWRLVSGHARDEKARAFLTRHIGGYITSARQRNRQMIQAQRIIRRVLARRHVAALLNCTFTAEAVPAIERVAARLRRIAK